MRGAGKLFEESISKNYDFSTYKNKLNRSKTQHSDSSVGVKNRPDLNPQLNKHPSSNKVNIYNNKDMIKMSQTMTSKFASDSLSKHNIGPYAQTQNQGFFQKTNGSGFKSDSQAKIKRNYQHELITTVKPTANQSTKFNTNKRSYSSNSKVEIVNPQTNFYNTGQVSNFNALTTPKSNTFYIGGGNFFKGETSNSTSAQRNNLFQSPNKDYLGIKNSNKPTKLNSYRRNFQNSQASTVQESAQRYVSPYSLAKSNQNPLNSLSSNGDSNIFLLKSVNFTRMKSPSNAIEDPSYYMQKQEDMSYDMKVSSKKTRDLMDSLNSQIKNISQAMSNAQVNLIFLYLKLLS